MSSASLKFLINFLKNFCEKPLIHSPDILIAHAVRN